MGCGSVIYVSGSILLTVTFLAVGISFFGPFWLSNIGTAYGKESAMKQFPYLPTNQTYLYPDRGLWAQCGVECAWFWEDGNKVQHLMTELRWHLATEILYFIGAAIILFCEVIQRVHMCCCDRHHALLRALGISILVSVVLQTSAVAVFGGGASRDYNAIADPRKFTEYLGQSFKPGSGEVGYSRPYLSWCYWMAVVGDMLSVVCGVLFIIASVCRKHKD